MTSKERMLKALCREKPDRLPATIHQWQPYHLSHYMDSITDLEAFRAVGLDASISCFSADEPTSPAWQVARRVETRPGITMAHTTITTPGGVLTLSECGNEMTTWIMDRLIKQPEDIALLAKYRPIPVLDREGAIRAYDALGDDGILRSFVFGGQGGCWQDACELYGVENLIYAAIDDPDWVHAFLSILLEQKLRFIEDNLRGLPFDLIETGGGAASNTVISPTLHREFCLPYDQRLHDALHSAGHKVVYHTCGGMTHILDQIVANRCDASETLSPTGVGGDIGTDADASLVKNALLPHVAMIGGMDQFHVLGEGTRTEIEREVQRLFRLFGSDGGYVCSASDHFFHVEPENLMAFAEAAKGCGY